ncbi:hypothetical protein Tco_1328177 [Tanacetum coccineum]
MAQDNGNAYVEIWPGRSFDAMPKPDREAIITLHEEIVDCMPPQPSNNSENETEPRATHGSRSSTFKSLTK